KANASATSPSVRATWRRPSTGWTSTPMCGCPPPPLIKFCAVHKLSTTAAHLSATNATADSGPSKFSNKINSLPAGTLLAALQHAGAVAGRPEASVDAPGGPQHREPEDGVC